MKQLVKSRTIYSNYDLWEKYPDDVLTQLALDCEWVESADDITEEMLINWRYEEDSFDWDSTWTELKNFFEGKTVIFLGMVGLWTGCAPAGEVGDFKELFNSAIKDCDYVKFYDENGHLSLKCSHHDGTNVFEIKVLTEKGIDYLDRWQYGYDNRTEESVHYQIFKRYSTVPNFAHTVYGCPKREYEPQSKERFMDIISNQARSNYC